MRILWVSDSPTSPSGFGAVTRAVCSRLARRGHRVEIVGWQNHGSTTRWEGIPVHPVRHDMFGSDVLLGYLMRLQPDFVVTLGDVWWLSSLADPPLQRWFDLAGTRWALYYPIDGADRDGRLPEGWRRVLEAADVPIAMSRFGAQVTRASGIECATIPHGCDLDVFRPPECKHEAKATCGYAGRFVILSDARNQPRKLLPRVLDITSSFARDKNDVVLHLHCDPDDDAATSELYSYRLRQDIAALGLADVARFTPGFVMRTSAGLTTEELASLYGAADVHLLSSWGEGFGLPNLQAASAGVVPLAGAFAASRELVDGHGYALPTESSMVDEFGLVRGLVSRDAAVHALEELYGDRELLAERSRRSREFALAYGWDELVDRWEDILGAAPPRRKPARTRSFEWIAGRDGGTQLTELPEPVAEVTADVLGSLPDGASVTVRMTERRHGEVAAEIYRGAFAEGEELSIPVRLPPLFEGAPRSTVGNLLIAPGDLPLAVELRRVFPRVIVSVPRPGGDPDSTVATPLEELLPPLPHYALVLDYTGDAAPNLDVACAALGVPYAGSASSLWPPIPRSSPFLQARLLLTDQGYSEARRREAVRRVELAYGKPTVEALRAAALAGQPEERSPDEVRRGPSIPTEMFLVRARDGSPPDTNGLIAEFVANVGGLILMATGADSLIVALPSEAKPALEAHEFVGFVGGIGLDEEGKAARELKALFATNAARQLVERDPALAAGGRG